MGVRSYAYSTMVRSVFSPNPTVIRSLRAVGSKATVWAFGNRLDHERGAPINPLPLGRARRDDCGGRSLTEADPRSRSTIVDVPFTPGHTISATLRICALLPTGTRRFARWERRVVFICDRHWPNATHVTRIRTQLGKLGALVNLRADRSLQVFRNYIGRARSNGVGGFRIRERFSISSKPSAIDKQMPNSNGPIRGTLAIDYASDFLSR